MSINFPKEEERILKQWEEINAFQRQVELTKGCPPYTFYDGPPFATGLPHYGHLLTSTIKDIVPRYWSMNGRYVERRFGWDTHGVPIEHEIDKKLNIQSKDDVMKLGIDKYNAECRAIVMRFATEWRKTITRLGRWIDFDNDYKVSYCYETVTNFSLILSLRLWISHLWSPSGGSLNSYGKRMPSIEAIVLCLTRLLLQLH
jgi:isoleucyl-tRNA synthetase